LLGDVRKDPRFKEIIRKIGFADLWRKTVSGAASVALSAPTTSSASECS
jgi:hypothetical protein